MEACVVFEDDYIIVCHKASGIASQTNRVGQKDMVSLLRNYRSKKGEDSYIGLVHRLDQPVEGLMVFAKTKEAAANLSKQMTGNGFGKHYYACVLVDDDSFAREAVLEDYLSTDKKTNYTVISDQNNPNAKKAKLEYKVVRDAVFSDETEGKKGLILDVKLYTGRQHQIRVQLAGAKAPIIGDSKYGYMPKKARVAIGLCSYRIEFTHPKTGKKCQFEIEPDNKLFSKD